ncbi:malonic semialdehyde reductase [Rhodocyclus tenuis]|uniref:Putative NADH dehydrogenase/NAD(P)H nitroreductase GGD90_000270 n=1 Tax=Rhodocyclus tenuis TaxID=1066 RepID=A0A840G3N0_RHOTE|nr:malonic semialdehyde reductase [Rhodocyclus tenuis]MBB4245921.1 3-hydroxypropanoate dehydrogenase [Rhodocyclus tenuis]
MQTSTATPDEGGDIKSCVRQALSAGPVPETALAAIFLAARTHARWTARPVADEILQFAYELARMAPTAANCQPLRIVFVRSAEAKARLLPALAPGNVDKTLSAPVTAILAWDTRFYELLPKLFPHTDARAWYAGDDKAALAHETAFRSASLQAAYFILAARALGLDCGPMSGFDNATVDREFFADGRFRSNFLCNLGYGDASALHPRSPRLDFAEACAIL